MIHNKVMSYFHFSLFFSLLLIILFGAHYFFYFSLTHFFSFLPKNILAWILGFLSISFFLTSFLVRWEENVITRSLAFFSGLWLGFLTNLVLAAAAIWVMRGIVNLIGFSFSWEKISLIFLGTAIVYSGWGIWNAFHPQVKNIEVTIPNLPESWQGKKVVQISDVHLGAINQKSFLSQVVKKINSVNPEMVFITGDLFDGMDGNLSSFSPFLDDIQAEKGIFFVTGNHETYVGLKEVFEALEKTKIRVLNDELVDIDGIKLIGLSYPERGERKNIKVSLAKWQEEYQGQPTILLYHAPVDIEEIKNTGINLELCGHTHRGQLFPFGYVTKLIYKGYDYGLFSQEDYTLYTSSGTGFWGIPMRTGNRPEIVVITLR